MESPHTIDLFQVRKFAGVRETFSGWLNFPFAFHYYFFIRLRSGKFRVRTERDCNKESGNKKKEENAGKLSGMQLKVLTSLARQPASYYPFRMYFCLSFTSGNK